MSKPKNYDFAGWATVYNRKCSDGRTIKPGAFSDCDGEVPMFWNHMHNDPSCLIGKAYLEHRDTGVYMYGSFNNNEKALDTKEALMHGDFKSISIYANQLQHVGGDVYHGRIREASLVPAGANPTALIDEVICHNDDEESTEAIIYAGEDDELELYHSEDGATNEKKEDNKMADKTIQQVYDEMTEEQQLVVKALIGQAVADAMENGGTEDVKHNVFDEDSTPRDNYLSHSEMQEIFNEARRGGGNSLKETFLAHGIENLEVLFPEPKDIPGQKLQWINQETGWVSKIMSGVHRTPFSRIKSMFADITADEARARGYIKGHYKKEEVFTLLKRTTEPTTIYKKQRFDRDDLEDIVDIDVIAEVKNEMRGKLNEEIATAIMLGDGRSPASEDKVPEDRIRPIWTDEDLFTVKAPVIVASGTTSAQRTKAFIETVIRSRKNYKGTGNPSLYTTEDVLTDCLLLEDAVGRRLYKTEDELRTALRVKEIVTMAPMENKTRFDNGNTYTLMGIVVNLADYNIGADKGGAVTLFDNFDIDYNKLKYLIETRCSGALTRPYSAIAIEMAISLVHFVEPDDPTTARYGKLVSDLQEDVIVHDKFIEGTLKYVEGYTGWSGDVSEQSGNYLALTFDATVGATTTVELVGSGKAPVEVSDGFCVFRIVNKAYKIKVVTTDGTNSVSTVYDLRSLTLEKADD